MIKIWANCLVAGTKTWSEVKESRKEEVKAEWQRRVEVGEITQEVFNRILGIVTE